MYTTITAGPVVEEEALHVFKTPPCAHSVCVKAWPATNYALISDYNISVVYTQGLLTDYRYLGDTTLCYQDNTESRDLYHVIERVDLVMGRTGFNFQGVNHAVCSHHPITVTTLRY